MKPGTKRWHCYQGQTRIGKRVPLGETPVNLPGHTPWKLGAGPHSSAAIEQITIGIRRVMAGVPKSPEQKAKMSAASKGKPKSALHKLHMSESHLRRIYGDKE